MNLVLLIVATLQVPSFSGLQLVGKQASCECSQGEVIFLDKLGSYI